MQLSVNPNRMELLKLKTRLKIAKRGHTLLRNKQDELMRQLNLLIQQYRGLRKNVETQLIRILKEFIHARQMSSFAKLAEAILFPQSKFTLNAKTKKIMNLVVPTFTLENEPKIPAYSFSETPSDIDIALEDLKKFFPQLIQLAELEISIQLLAEETNKTRRRVNALEYVLIPRIEDTIKYIGMKLDELERANLTRLMRIKDIVQK